MALVLWEFWTYSFLGYLLEKGFAAVTHAEHRTRKCFLLLPLCPVYGLAVLAVLALPPVLTAGFWGRAVWGGLTATAVEYAVHLTYDRLVHVQFWDYRSVPGNLRGRVCLPFSVIWGLLLGLALPAVQTALAPALAAVPAWITDGALLLFTLDAVVSLRVLWVTGDTEALALPYGRWM